MVQVLSLSLAIAAEPMASCPMVKITLERLPDLNIPRHGHSLLCIGNEMVVFGGHTTGFVPTPTAEYFSKGKWHVLPMVYPHDNGLIVKMKSGDVLLGGGHESSLGIGQTFAAEIYHSGTHSFEGFASMEKKRALASGTELDGGRLVIAGNWYADDGIELFDGSKHFLQGKEVAVDRSSPYVLRIADDDAIIFGAANCHGIYKDTILIDRLKGEPYTVPLFEEWEPFYMEQANNECGFIGDEKKGLYSYLLPIIHKHDGQIGIAKVDGTEISQLSTISPIPIEGLDGLITYNSFVMVHRPSQRGYLVGTDEAQRGYVLAIDYAQTPAPLMLYYTDPLVSEPSLWVTALTSEGNLMLAGGNNNNNFKPLAFVYLLYLNGQPVVQDAFMRAWVWWLVALAVLILLAALWLIHRRRMASPDEAIITSPVIETTETLMNHINELMEKEQLFRNSELKVTDVAVRLGVSSREVSCCIKDTQGTSFIQFVNNLRVNYAKQQLRLYPGKKVSEIGSESGFASDRSFFRIFKAITGMTAQEWISRDA